MRFYEVSNYGISREFDCEAWQVEGSFILLHGAVPVTEAGINPGEKRGVIIIPALATNPAAQVYWKSDEQ